MRFILIHMISRVYFLFSIDIFLIFITFYFDVYYVLADIKLIVTIFQE